VQPLHTIDKSTDLFLDNANFCFLHNKEAFYDGILQCPIMISMDKRGVVAHVACSMSHFNYIAYALMTLVLESHIIDLYQIFHRTLIILKELWFLNIQIEHQ